MARPRRRFTGRLALQCGMSHLLAERYKGNINYNKHSAKRKESLLVNGERSDTYEDSLFTKRSDEGEMYDS